MRPSRKRIGLFVSVDRVGHQPPFRLFDEIWMFYEWRQRVEKPYRFMHEVKRLLIVVPTRFVCRSLSAVFVKQAADELLAKGHHGYALSS